jgi:hypothetical protein
MEIMTTRGGKGVGDGLGVSAGVAVRVGVGVRVSGGVGMSVPGTDVTETAVGTAVEAGGAVGVGLGPAHAARAASSSRQVMSLRRAVGTDKS